MKVKFELPLRIKSEWGMNRVYSGDHWSVRKHQASHIHLLVRSSIHKQCGKVKVFSEPVHIRIMYNSRLDIDNHGYISKLIIDGMKGVLLKDDDRRYVQELIQCFHGDNNQTVYVEVWDERNDEECIIESF